jgi:hypothetical protein
MTQTILNLGTGGAALNGQNGSTAGADSNDALFLDWDGENYVYLIGGTGNNNAQMTTPSAAALNITGDIDLRVRVNRDSAGTMLAKWSNTAGNRSYRFTATTAGGMTLFWSEDGLTAISQTSVSQTQFPVGTVGWFRVTLDVDNGASGHDVKFFLSDDGVTWTQLGSTITTAGTTSIYSGNESVRVGRSGAGATSAPGKYYRAQIFDGIEESGGTKVLDVDTSVITGGNTTTFSALTGQTITIDRASSGRKSTAVVSPVWLFGTDDYMEVADNDLLDFGATDSFSLVAIHRTWAVRGSNATLLAKKANTTNTTAGYNLSNGSSTSTQGQAQIGDGSAGITAVSDARPSGALVVTTAVRDVAANTLTVYLNNTAGTPITDTSTGAISNSEVFRIGRLSGAGTEYIDMELISVAVFRRALSPAEISALITYYQNRLS